MRLSAATFFLVLSAGVGFAQCHKLAEVNAEKPEGQALQAIGQEAVDAKRLVLMEEFVGKYPQNEATGWVYEQMQGLYIKANNFDKALEAGEKLAAIPPECIEVAHQTLKAAEAKKDPAQIKKWAA